MVFPDWAWVAFGAFILLMLVLDLFVLHRSAKEISFREAAVLSAFWVVLALLFGVLIWFWAGPTTAGEYYAGYIIEKALSVDNVFVFALIFAYFAVPVEYQYRVLFWGVVGALVLRVMFILIGAELLETYNWIVYLFGALPNLHGYPNGSSQQPGGPTRTKSRPTPAPAYPAHYRRLPWSEAPRPGARQANGVTTSGGLDRGGDYRRGGVVLKIQTNSNCASASC